MIKFRSLFYAALVSLTPMLAQAQVITAVSNAGTTGTTIGSLAKLTGAPSTAVTTATTDVVGAQGIVTGWTCVSPSGTAPVNACSGSVPTATTGFALIAHSGQALCTFDGATTAGDYVTISATTAGDCLDTGSATFPSKGQVIGRVLSTIGSTGPATVAIYDGVAGVPGNGIGSGATITSQISAAYLACTPVLTNVSTGTTETPIASCAIPGGLMSANSWARISVFVTRTAGTNSDVFKLRMGTANNISGTQIGPNQTLNTAAQLGQTWVGYFLNNGSTTANIGGQLMTTGLINTAGSAAVALTLNTASPVWIVVTGTPGVSGDVLTGVSMSVEYLPSAGGT